ncbi:MAG TPA: hypothetical protein PLV78_14575 [Deltaproteobacteria bacterium]|nr:hypothetical protein [Deltaproteobacteria bacterium]
MAMKKTIVLVVCVILAAGTLQAYARRDHDDRHYSGGEDDVWLCPWCDDESGNNNADNVENSGDEDLNRYQYYRDRYKMDYEKRLPEVEKPITMDQARRIVDDYISRSEIPGLRPGEIIENDNDFDAEILTEDGKYMDMLIIDKHTGMIK